jgi:hypothetical protein
MLFQKIIDSYLLLAHAHEMNTYRADSICLFVMFQLEKRWRTEIDEICNWTLSDAGDF